MDVPVEGEPDPENFAAMLRKTLPPALKVLSARIIPDDFPTLMALVAGSELRVEIDPGAEADKVAEAFRRFMNRRYTREKYLERVQALRKAVPNIGLTTDLIVGFPGETDAQFEDTVSLVQTVGYDSAFTFIYSPRKGTKAAELPGQIAADVSSRRIQRLIETVEAGTATIHQSLIGQNEAVLVESLSKRDGRMVSGKGTRGITITFEGSEADIGQIIPVTITSAAVNTLRAVRK